VRAYRVAVEVQKIANLGPTIACAYVHKG
jgi:hypothetical protein